MYITAELKGNGFGNEFIQLAKLLICRKELGLPVLPAYWRSAYRSVIPSDLYFSNRMQRALRLCADPVRFRTLRFDDAAHQTTGKIPIQEALSVFMQEHGLNGSRRTLIEFSGISPGLEAIESHGVFLFEQLLSAANITPLLNERFQGLDEDKLLVGVHIRRGDFRPPLPLGTAWPNKQWNIQIPLEWYEGVCQKLTEAFPGRVQLIVSTDQADHSMFRLCKRFQALLLTAGDSRMSPDVVDLLTLASCDALIASASTFSGLAVIFKPKPWLWYPCAHGMPPWGREAGSLYLDEPQLPELFLTQAESTLRRKAEQV